MINENAKKYGSSGSAIRELFEFGKKRKAIVGEENVYDFSIGNPSVAAPKEFNDSILKVLNEMEPTILHGYTSAIGDEKAREAIANQLNAKYDANADKNLIYLVCGAAAGLTITLKALIASPDDEIIVFAPFFPEYSVFIENAGGKRVIAKTNDKMLIDLDELEKVITKNTKAVIIDSPNNPTGVMYDENIIKGLANYLNKKQQEYGHEIYLISDEPYRELVYSDKKYPFVTRFYDNSIVVYSFSKSLSLPGERIGYILVGSKMKDANDVYDAVKGAGRLMGFVCAPSLFQFVLPYAVNYTSDLSIYAENRDILYKGLTDLGYEVIYPEGAFYMFVKALESDAKEFSKKAMEHDLLIVPSDSFGITGYVRIAYCVSKNTIVNSMPAFKALKEEYER